MAVIAIIAGNLAIGRSIYAYKPDLLLGIALTGPLFEVGLYRFIRSRGRARAFWLGFVASGLLAASSYSWTTIRPKMTARVLDQASMTVVTVNSPGAPLSDLWLDYTTLAIDCLEYVPSCADIRTWAWDRPTTIVVDALIVLLPQLVIGLAGGLLGLLVGWTADLRRRRELSREANLTR
jgi:hypothetical protein